jgi:hypothetical protein
MLERSALQSLAVRPPKIRSLQKYLKKQLKRNLKQKFLPIHLKILLLKNPFLRSLWEAREQIPDKYIDYGRAKPSLFS